MRINFRWSRGARLACEAVVSRETSRHSTLSVLRSIVLRSKLGRRLGYPAGNAGHAPKSSIYTLQSVDKERAGVTYHSAHHGLVPRPREGTLQALADFCPEDV